MIQEQDQRILARSASDQQNPAPSEGQTHTQEASETNNTNDQIIDPFKQLTQNQNPIPLLAVLDRVDLQAKNEEGVPIFNLLCNKFLPLGSLLQDKNFTFETDRDGRTPLHYAVEVDDIKAAYQCLKRGAKNVKDNFGNTPVMDAVKYGHRRSFLLCIHFQHLNDSLPHIAAKYNRVWQLKALQSFGFDLWSRDEHAMTPLDTAIENYSYETAEYLTIISPNKQLPNLQTLTDSEAMIRRLIRVHLQKSTSNRVIIPLVTKFLFWLIVLIAINSYSCFDLSKKVRNKQMFLAIGLYGMIWVFSLIGEKQRSKGFNNILNILKEPYFPTMAEVCPCCIDFVDTDYDHCDQCKTCVPKFHQHKLFCINKKNQLAWYIYQFYWGWLLSSLLLEVFFWRRWTIVTANPVSYYIYELFLTMDLSYDKGDIMFMLFIVFVSFVWLQQFLFCLQLFGMSFMNRTYQHVTHSQDYPHLYEAFKSSDGKIKMKQTRIFMKYKLLGGLVVGLKNILLYFL